MFSSCGTVFARAVGTHGAVELFSVAELLEGKGGGGGGLGGGGGGNPPTLSASDWKQLRAPARPFAVLRGHTSTVFALSTVAASSAGAGEGGGGGGGGGYGGSPLSGPASFLLASGGADGAAVVWDLRRGGAPLATCFAFDHQVKSVGLGGGWRGYGGGGGGKEGPSGGWGAGVGSLIAYAGEGDAVVVEDWTQAAASGSFLPPRDPTATAAAAAATRPASSSSYQLRVYVPRVESLAWSPAVVSRDNGAPSTSAAASAGAEGSENNGDNPPSSSSPRASSSKRSPLQSNVGALAFVRCIPAGGGGGGVAGLQQGRGGGGEVIGAVGLFAPPPPSAR